MMKVTAGLGAGLAMLAVSGCSTTVNNNYAAEQAVGAAAAQKRSSASAPELLRPYYARLAAETDLPAMRSPALDLAAPLHRIAFGSCNHQNRSQDAWAHIAATGPDVFLAIGDNVYGDYGYRGEADLGSFEAAYRKQAAHPEFQRFMAAQPVYATWDDHDYGPNDSGGSFFAREWSETMFETFWDMPQEARARPGIYHSVMTGPAGQRTQIIMLDTRFFRSDLVEKPYSEERYPLGIYQPNPDPAATVLGNAQWRWLQGELAKPADLRIVVSSIQVLTNAHDYESWENFPLQREMLFRMLKVRENSGLVLLSGDRHSGAVYSDTPAALGERVWELTSSSLNLAFVRNDAGEQEPDPLRMSDFITQENFGLVDIDWAQRHVHLRLLDDEGGQIVSRQMAF